MTTDEAMLAEVPLFALLDTEERSTLAELLNAIHVDKGDVIFSYGDSGDSLYIVRRGRVQIYMEDTRGQRILLAESGPSELFGEISLLDGGPRTASAMATEPTVLLVLDREDLLEFIIKRPPAALSLLTVMGQRLRATNELLRMRTSRNVNQEEAEQLTVGHRVADRMTALVGSWGFLAVFLIASLAASYLVGDRIGQMTGLERSLPGLLGLGFGALGALGVVAVFQMSLLLMSQQRQTAKDRLKADLDYDFNLKAELELAQLTQNVGIICEQLRARDSLAESHTETELPVGRGPRGASS